MSYISIAEKLRKQNVAVSEAVEGAVLSAFGSGGKVDYLVEPSTIEQLIASIEILGDSPYCILGGGCNSLISDNGLRCALSLRRLTAVTVHGRGMECLAGTRLATIAALAEKHSFSGAEFLTGIPGTLGGAVTMNAGAFGSEMKDIITSVKLLENGKIVEYSADRLGLRYRHSEVGDRIVISAGIELSSAALKEIRALSTKYREYRMRTQPFGRSLGSVFKKANGLSAAVYIEKTGLKGMTIGGAQLSSKHCNFIVNKGSAKSADYLAIVDMVRSKVAKQGIELELENKLLGYE